MCYGPLKEPMIPRGAVAVDQMSVRNKKQMNKPGIDLQRGRDMMQRFHEGLCS